jgi:ribosomal-protein-alanine N-acetyltransferase
MDIPTLRTSRLLMRGLRASDWDAYAALLADPAVRKWVGGQVLSREQSWAEMETILGQWALRGYGRFAVEADGQFAGRVGIKHAAGWPEPELTWTLATPFWGKGLATEAATEVRRWAFAQFGWRRLVSYITPENQRSRRVADKLGAVLDGRIILLGAVVDVWIHPAPGRGIVA